MRTALIFGFVLLAGFAMAASEGKKSEPVTELGKLAQALNPGEWKELKTQGFSKALLTSGNKGILPYADSGAWDAKNQTVHFVGQGHLAPPPQHIIYSAKTNTWRKECPAWLAKLKWFHGYENTAADPINGLVFHHPSASQVVHCLDAGQKKWSLLPNLPSGTSRGHGTAVTFFPDMGEKGSLIRFYAGKGQRFDMAEQKWSSLVGEFSKAKSYHNVAEYNPRHKVVLFGGGNGSKQLYVLARDGTIKTLPEAPCWIGSSVSHLAVCPTSGEALLIGRHKESQGFYALDLSDEKATWRTLPAPPISKGVIVTLSSYGLVMCFDYARVMVYKHKPAKRSL